MSPDRDAIIRGLRNSAASLSEAAEGENLNPGGLVVMTPNGAGHLATLLRHAAEELESSARVFRFDPRRRKEPAVRAMARAWLEVTDRMASAFAPDSDFPAPLTAAELAEIAQRAGLLETLAKAWPVLHAFDAATYTGTHTGTAPRSDRSEQGA